MSYYDADRDDRDRANRERENWAEAAAQEAEDRAQYELDIAQHMADRENAEIDRDRS